MNKLILFVVLLFWSAYSLAAGTQYDLRVDGLACPFCAYGVEKNISKTSGVESVEIDLIKGLVIVKVSEGITYSEAEFKKLINDAGFTLHSMSQKSL